MSSYVDTLSRSSCQTSMNRFFGNSSKSSLFARWDDGNKFVIAYFFSLYVLLQRGGIFVDLFEALRDFPCCWCFFGLHFEAPGPRLGFKAPQEIERWLMPGNSWSNVLCHTWIWCRLGALLRGEICCDIWHIQAPLLPWITSWITRIYYRPPCAIPYLSSVRLIISFLHALIFRWFKVEVVRGRVLASRGSGLSCRLSSPLLKRLVSVSSPMWCFLSLRRFLQFVSYLEGSVSVKMNRLYEEWGCC